MITNVSGIMGEYPQIAASFYSERNGNFSVEAFGRNINSNEPEMGLIFAVNDNKKLDFYIKVGKLDLSKGNPAINLEIKINEIYAKFDCQVESRNPPDFGLSMNLDTSFGSFSLSMSLKDLQGDSPNLQINFDSEKTHLNILIDLKQINS